jgi:membrane protein
MTDLMNIITAVRRRLLYLAGRYQRDRCRDSAAALTYMSLFALVPLLTVLYTIASAVPAFQGVEANIQDLLFEHLVPETSAGLEDYLQDFSRQAKNLTGFGIAFLVGTAILMLSSVEQAFNQIWRTQGNRGPISSFLLYWAVLSLTPVTIGLGLAVSASLASFTDELVRWDLIGIGAALLSLSPYILQILGFTLIYAAVPNCRVPFRHALIGGVVAGIGFNIARALFTKLFAGSSITFIYGAFAAVPLFLLWIYISWNIVLIAAIIVHSLSAYQSEAQARRPMLLKALELLQFLWQRQSDGRSVGELELLSRSSLSLDAESWQQLRDLLVRKRVITQDENGRYLLSRDLHKLPMWQLQEWLGGTGEVPGDNDTLPPWERHTVALLQQQRNNNRDLFSPSIAEFLAHEKA